MKRMRKYIIVCLCLAAAYLLGAYLYYYTGFHIDIFTPEPTTFTKTRGKTIYLFEDGEYREFEIRGVDMGAGKPGHFATDLAITEEEYLRWFKSIQDMGANTVRVYTILGDPFYNAVYQYNKNNDNPLYIMHGLWLDDYVQLSYRDAFDDEFLGELETDGRTMIDVIHGRRTVNLGKDAGTGVFRKDISPWVIGYILGVEWEDVTVEYTDRVKDDKGSYAGKYMKTSAEATPFEAMLARLGDGLIEYETKRFGTQRLIAFSNWPTTDPFDYEDIVAYHFFKFSKVDVEHIETTPAFLSGAFASYHVYPYYPDYLSYTMQDAECLDPDGDVNTYYTYLKMLADHHTMPVIISEYGVPSSRGMAQRDKHTARNQGGMSETDQAEALVACYQDVMDSGCAGSILFTWQDEWFKRTWNTMYAVDLMKTPFWSDYQTNEQYFGILSFDPGDEECVCYVNGNRDDWAGAVPVIQSGGLSLSAKYDEKFVYLLVEKEGLTIGDRLHIPIDTTQKSGAYYCDNYDISFDRGADFIIRLDGADNSRLLVQARYETLRAAKSLETTGVNAFTDPPATDCTQFEKINLLLQTAVMLEEYIHAEYTLKAFLSLDRPYAEVYETGKLTMGNADPSSPDYNSLADFCYGDGFVEIKLPWQLLNFGNPSEMKIHDDYYEHYGVELMSIDKMYLGVAEDAGETAKIPLAPLALTGWGNKVTYHERLKPAYYALKNLWTGSPAAEGGDAP